MTDTNDILKALESLKSDMATKRDLDVIKKDIATKSDLQDVKHAQTQTNSKVDTLASGQAQLIQGQARIHTAIEALKAGQDDIREKMATKADVLTVEVKVDKLRKRIEGIEEHTGSSTHKN
jgi:hypothetical protein